MTGSSADATGSTPSRRYSVDRGALEKQVIIEPYRAPGPGGQRKNRKETAVRLTHTPTGITVVASERRSQAQNREIAFQRLIKRLTQLNRPRKRRLPTKPSARAIRSRREAKERLSQKKRLRRESSTPADFD